ncbi:MAG: alpha/beta fold hydrolase [Patescibacteria group bacterium]|nr:alpha/beta fold hydrolase [Patescibacteria group bacterium]
MSEKVSFNTEDGVTIVADHYTGEPDGPAALLLHMMPAMKESWLGFAEALLAEGFTHVLAIDLRGHGESTDRGGEKLDYKHFEDLDHQAKIKDVEAAVAWLEERGVVKGRLAVVGASIGANLAIAYGGAHDEVPAVVALSPGFDYRGVTTPDKVEMFAESQGLYLVASEDDTLSFETNRKLAVIKDDAILKEFKEAGHGTTMFELAPDLMAEVVGWMKEIVK